MFTEISHDKMYLDQLYKNIEWHENIDDAGLTVNLSDLSWARSNVINIAQMGSISLKCEQYRSNGLNIAQMWSIYRSNGLNIAQTKSISLKWAPKDLNIAQMG